MILIASAAYVDQDLSAEVGLIPPSFLPIGNQRLYEHQIASLSSLKEDIYLSLPASFSLGDSDVACIKKLGVNILFVPDGVSLGESVLYSWNATGKNYSQLKILHGDTLFLDEMNFEGDFVSVSDNRGAYYRALVESDELNNLIALKQRWINDGSTVLSGLFCFTNPQLFMKCIIEAKNDFISSIVQYSEKLSIKCENFGEWLDFGHLNSFFASRTTMTTQRVFNDLTITRRSVTKKSQDLVKIKAESSWFEKLPYSLRIYTPTLLIPYFEKGSKASYTIEYLYLLPLSDLFVFGRHSVGAWKQIFASAKDVLDDFRATTSQVDATVDIQSFDQLYLKKTLSRLNDNKQKMVLDIDELIAMAHQSSHYISNPKYAHCSIVHGDFCFSNLLFDSRTQSLKLIDPRGLDGQRNFTLLGDQRYDLAKFFHSVVGCYDLIIAGRYSFQNESIQFYDVERLDLIEEAFDEVFCQNDALVCKQELLAINVHLFLSMLPLHSDRPDRQRAMVLNAKRLFIKLMDSL
ncbi:hypothetical protein [Marinimicrobium sp. C2-29]|uniref:hypothetical protein n=1 Tax=Marinimicrobium sp. C2-29 TaxID=3139825 RepID=UPI003138853B